MLLIAYPRADAGERHYVDTRVNGMTMCTADTRGLDGVQWDVNVKGGKATCERCLFAADVLGETEGAMPVGP